MPMRNVLLSLAFLGIFMPRIHADGSDSLPSANYNAYYDSSWAFWLDSLIHQHYFEYDRFTTDTCHLNSFGFDTGEIPVFPDEFYRIMFAEMDASSPISYQYNSDVRTWVELYTLRRRTLLSKVMGLSEVYFPMFEAELDRQGLPLELKYLAVIESALNPVAISRAGAGGLWQFMPGTGKIYGLEVNSVVDERADPFLATRAACEHLNDLYNIFDDWLLALAAYNSGTGNVKKAMRLSGGKTFYEISRYLPKETRGYVPAFLAVSYIMENPHRYNVYPMNPALRSYQFDTVSIDFRLPFKLLTDSLGIPIEELTMLNPSYLQGYIPASPAKPRTLTLPLNKMGLYMNFEAVARDMYSKGLLDNYGRVAVHESGSAVVHVVKRGESLGSIASKHRTTVSKIKQLNNLKSNTIHPGQRLVISRPVRSNLPSSSLAGANREVFREAFEYHTVLEGETLESIAGSYEFTTLNELLRLNSDLPTDTLIPAGTKVRIREIQP
jgi:membrane-bound lytic murein transglycosylase D